LKQTETKLRTVNPTTIISDRRVPFGGIKNSGFGRVIEIWNVRICQHKISQILRSINSQSLCGIMQYDYM
jgi:acyl-CoA reductase-like NAD-dependent aldehyde dehydrogenase